MSGTPGGLLQLIGIKYIAKGGYIVSCAVPRSIHICVIHDVEECPIDIGTVILVMPLEGLLTLHEIIVEVDETLPLLARSIAAILRDGEDQVCPLADDVKESV